MDRAGYRPLPESEDSFWRIKQLSGRASGRRYHSDSDPDYQPGDDVEEADWSEDHEEEEQAETEEVAGDSSFLASATQDGQRRLSTASTASTAVSISRAVYHAQPSWSASTCPPSCRPPPPSW